MDEVAAFVNKSEGGVPPPYSFSLYLQPYTLYLKPSTLYLYPAASCFNRERAGHENASLWQGKMALLVKIGSLSRS